MDTESNSPPARPRKNLWFMVSWGVVLILVAWAFFLLRKDPVIDHQELIGEAAPEIRFETESGDAKSTKEFEGQALLINFWAVWCQPCLDEMPSLAALENHFASQGLTVLAFDIEGGGEDIRGTLSGIDLPKNLIVNFNKAQLRSYDVHAIPLSILIDRGGLVRNVYTGPRDWMDVDTIREVERVLSKSGSGS